MPEMWVTPESDWKQAGKSSVEEMWNEKLMTITSKDGLYQGKLEALIAIDLADPNDPNLGLIAPMNTLKWFNNKPDVRNLMVKDQDTVTSCISVVVRCSTRIQKNITLQKIFNSGLMDLIVLMPMLMPKGVLNTTSYVFRNS